MLAEVEVLEPAAAATSPDDVCGVLELASVEKLAVVRAFRREVPYVRDAARSVARSPTESIDVRGEEESLEEGASGGSWPVILAAFSVSKLFLL